MKISLSDILNDKKNILKKDIFNLILFFVFFCIFIILFIKDNEKCFCIIICSIFYITILFSKFKAYNYYNKFNKNKFEELEMSLNNSIFYSKENYVITEDCIISIGNYIEKIKYEDIVLIYKEKILEHNTIRKNEVLTIVLNNKKKYWFYILVRDSIRNDIKTYDFSNIILEKNPNVLVGKTKENKQKILREYGIKI